MEDWSPHWHFSIAVCEQSWIFSLDDSLHPQERERATIPLRNSRQIGDGVLHSNRRWSVPPSISSMTSAAIVTKDLRAIERVARRCGGLTLLLACAQERSGQKNQAQKQWYKLSEFTE